MIGKLITRIKSSGSGQHSEFLSHFAVLASGSLLAQAIPTVVSPLLTRLYSASDLGLLAILTAWVSLAGVVATGRYEFALMKSEGDHEAANLFVLAATLAALSAMCCGFCLLVIGVAFPRLVSEHTGLAHWAWSIPIVVFLTGASQCCNGWLNRGKRYRQMAIGQVALSAGQAGASAIAGFAKLGTTGLVAAWMTANLVSAGLLSRFVISHFESEKLRPLCLSNYACKHRSFPLKSAFGALLNTIANQGPTIAIGAFYNMHEAGLYSLTVRVLQAPSGLVGSAFSQVFYKQATEAARSGRLKPLVRKTTIWLLAGVSIPMICILLGGEGLFRWVFGASWETAGLIAQIMTPFYTLRFVFACQATIAMVQDRMGFEVLYNAALLFSQASAFVIGLLYFKSLKATVWMMSIGGAFVYACCLAWLWRVANENSKPSQMESDHEKGGQ